MFDLELERVVKEIKENKARKVLIQLPDGLKTRAGEVALRIEKETGTTVLIWLGSCYGACDIPLGINTLGIDTVIQFGHNQFNKMVEW